MENRRNSDAWYHRITRNHYQDAQVASGYSRRQALRVSPPEWLVARFEVRAIRRSLSLLAPLSKNSVLDIPAGSGKLTQMMSKLFKRYVAGDISQAMLNLIPGDVEKVKMDATALPYEDDMFEIVVNLRLCHRIPRDLVSQCVREAIRVSQVGAVISYAGFSQFPLLHRVIRSVARRNDNSYTQITGAEFNQLVATSGGSILSDRSISYGVTTERIVTIRKVR